MSARNHTVIQGAALAMLSLAFSAAAGPSRPGVPGASQARVSTNALASGPVSPRERADLGRALATKWGIYVQRVYGVDAATWAERMAPDIAAADGDNLRNALARDTFEGAMAELGGAGARLSDDEAIEKLAAAGGNPVPQVLGALGNDLVYTPITPCRIIDTRNMAAGPIAANSVRSFYVINGSSFTSQGGSATNCGTLGLSATAVAINLTAVSPSAAGYATAYPYGSSQPLASSINYTAGAIVNNALIAQIPNPLSINDLNLYTFAQAHYVADIVGYFAPPVATALQCVETTDTTLNITAGSVTVLDAAACPAGYTPTSTSCVTTGTLMPLLDIQNGRCSARNGDSVTQTLRASRTCCRVPGR